MERILIAVSFVFAAVFAFYVVYSFVGPSLWSAW